MECPATIDNRQVVICFVTGSTNMRTGLATIVPNRIPLGHSLNRITTNDNVCNLFLLALFYSFVLDFYARMRLTGNDFNQTVIKALPIPRHASKSDHPHFLPLVAEDVKEGVLAEFRKL